MEKRPTRIIKEFASLVRNPKWPKQEFKVRILRYINTASILLDLREFVTSEVEGLPGGYTKKGMSITSVQFRHLIRMSPAILKIMERTERETEQAKENTLTLSDKTITLDNSRENSEVTQEDKESVPSTLSTQTLGEEVSDEAGDGKI
jgi:hypothetical protein